MNALASAPAVEPQILSGEQAGTAQHDVDRSTEIDGLLRDGFPLMRFPPTLEAEFKQFGLDARRSHFIKSGLMGLALFDAFLISDYMMVPDVFGWALLLRLGIFTPAALLMLWLFHKRVLPTLNNLPANGLEAIAMSTGLIAAGVFATVLNLSNSPLAYLHHIAFVTVIAYGNIVQRLRFWFATAFTLSVITMHVGGMAFLGEFPDRMVLPLFSMVVASAFFTLSANYTLERDERRRFLMMERERGLIRSLTQTQVRLRELSRVDDLTTLFNRRYFEESAQQLWQRAAFGRTPMAILMIDLDDFKKYNDHYGHPAGDACLHQVSLAMKLTLNDSDIIVARYGGEEFIAAIPHLSEEAVSALAEAVRLNIERCQIPHAASPTAPVVTASLGLAWCVARPELKMEHLLSLADGALYDAKSAGRNQVCRQSV